AQSDFQVRFLSAQACKPPRSPGSVRNLEGTHSSDSGSGDEKRIGSLAASSSPRSRIRVTKSPGLMKGSKVPIHSLLPNEGKNGRVGGSVPFSPSPLLPFSPSPLLPLSHSPILP